MICSQLYISNHTETVLREARILDPSFETLKERKNEQTQLKPFKRAVLEELDEKYTCHVLILQVFPNGPQNISELCKGGGNEYTQQLSGTTAVLAVSLINNKAF